MFKSLFTLSQIYNRNKEGDHDSQEIIRMDLFGISRNLGVVFGVETQYGTAALKAVVTRGKPFKVSIVPTVPVDIIEDDVNTLLTDTREVYDNKITYGLSLSRKQLLHTDPDYYADQTSLLYNLKFGGYGHTGPLKQSTLLLKEIDDGKDDIVVGKDGIAIILIMGPAGSGKTTLINKHKQEGYIDIDSLISHEIHVEMKKLRVIAMETDDWVEHNKILHGHYRNNIMKRLKRGINVLFGHGVEIISSLNLEPYIIKKVAYTLSNKMTLEAIEGRLHGRDMIVYSKKRFIEKMEQIAESMSIEVLKIVSWDDLQRVEHIIDAVKDSYKVRYVGPQFIMRRTRTIGSAVEILKKPETRDLVVVVNPAINDRLTTYEYKISTGMFVFHEVMPLSATFTCSTARANLGALPRYAPDYFQATDSISCSPLSYAPLEGGYIFPCQTFSRHELFDLIGFKYRANLFLKEMLIPFYTRVSLYAWVEVESNYYRLQYLNPGSFGFLLPVALCRGQMNVCVRYMEPYKPLRIPSYASIRSSPLITRSGADPSGHIIAMMYSHPSILCPALIDMMANFEEYKNEIKYEGSKITFGRFHTKLDYYCGMLMGLESYCCSDPPFVLRNVNKIIYKLKDVTSTQPGNILYEIIEMRLAAAPSAGLEKRLTNIAKTY
jgi:nicotinamide riboside kinase